MSNCKRCGKPIVWGQSENARNADGKPKWIALDPAPDALGIVELKGKTAVFAGVSHDPDARRYMPHEVTCSNPYKPTRTRNKETAR